MSCLEFIVLAFLCIFRCASGQYQLKPGGEGCNVQEDYAFNIVQLDCGVINDVNITFDGDSAPNRYITTITIDTIGQASVLNIASKGQLGKVVLNRGEPSRDCLKVYAPTGVDVYIGNTLCLKITSTVTTTIGHEPVTETKTTTLDPKTTTVYMTADPITERTIMVTVTKTLNTVSTVTVMDNSTTTPTVQLPSDDTSALEVLPVWLQAFLGSLFVSILTTLIMLTVYCCRRHRKKKNKKEVSLRQNIY